MGRLKKHDVAQTACYYYRQTQGSFERKRKRVMRYELEVIGVHAGIGVEKALEQAAGFNLVKSSSLPGLGSALAFC